MILFRVNNSENLGLKDTGGTNKLFSADLFWPPEFNILDWIINRWPWTLRVNHEEPCEDQSWQFRHQHTPTSACEGRVWPCDELSRSSWHVTTPVTRDDHRRDIHRSHPMQLSGMRNGGAGMTMGCNKSSFCWPLLLLVTQIVLCPDHLSNGLGRCGNPSLRSSDTMRWFTESYLNCLSLSG